MQKLCQQAAYAPKILYIKDLGAYYPGAAGPNIVIALT